MTLTINPTFTFSARKKMLLKQDLEWNYQILRSAAQLNWIPVEFDEVTGRMKSSKSIWRKILFKIWQCLMPCQVGFMTLRTLGSLSSSELDWDFLPIVMIACSSYLIVFVIIWNVFDSERDLNCKVYNEILHIHRKTIAKNK